MKPSTDCSTSATPGGCHSGLARREFLKLGSFLAAGWSFPRLAAAAGPFDAADFGYSLIPADKKLSAAWLRSLVERGEPTVYRGAELATIGMPVGGICTGQLYLGGDGRLWHWDIFNAPDPGLMSLTSGPHYANPLKATSPLAQGFALKVTAAGTTQVRKLDQSGFPGVTFQGQYPIGTVNYRAAGCPVEATLETYSPFIPLNAGDSGLPATVMEFSVKNTSAAPVEVELAGWLENAVCKFSPGVTGVRRNRVVRDGGMVRVEASAKDAPAAVSEPPREDIVFADFEDGSYGAWQTAGSAFGSRPVTAAEMPAYQNPQAIGAHGKALVNSHASAPGVDVGAKDGATGKLTSPAFTVARRLIRFLIGGGANADKLGLRLLVDGKVVRSATGHNDNKLRPESFDVREFAGRTAQLEIVDESGEGWGNIGVDHIVFTDQGPTPISAADAPDFGTLTLALLAAEPGDRACAEVGEANPAAVFQALGQDGKQDSEKAIPAILLGAVGRRWSLQPGEERRAVFVITWHFPRVQYTVPNLTAGWSNLRDFATLKRYYAKRFRNAAEVASYIGKEFARLSGETKRWRDTWYDSTLPHWLLDRTLLNISTLATTTCHRFDNGRYWFWEGIYCCQGTCTHVWHYAQAIARIFPEIERDLRERVDFGISFNATTGAIGARAEYDMAAATDGHAGSILRTLREHQMSPDAAFLKRNWPNVKKAVEWLVEQDGNGDGLISRGQPNTLDAEWFGEISWISSLYVAALKAGAEMAREMGDTAAAARWTAIATQGTEQISTRLFHQDQYFIQRPDPANLDKLGSGYGCEIDQVFGQSWAFQVGLNRVLPADLTRKALNALWRYNFTPDVGPFRKGTAIPGGRWYAMAGEGGLVMCSFPDPKNPKPLGGGGPAIYFNECMTGFEHQVASHMVWEGGDLVEKGLAVTRMIHDRYHASRRNPWNEVECGDHYGRAMASYGVFTAACGFAYHGPQRRLAFEPRLTPEKFAAAFTASEGWGRFSQHLAGDTFNAEVEVKWGRLALTILGLTPPGGLRPRQVSATLAGQPIAAKLLSMQAGRVEISFAPDLVIPVGQTLKVTLT
jgi:uncharacterized protein (DUF608 family)